MKKIVFVLDSLRLGGAEKVAFYIISSLSVRYLVSVVLVGEDKVEFELPKNVETLFVGDVKRPRLINKINKLRQIFSKINPDLIISFLNTPIIYSYFSAKKTNVPLMFCERNNPKRNPSSYVIRLLRNHCFRKADYCIFQTDDAMKYFKRRGINNSAIIPNPIDFPAEGFFHSKSRTNDIVCVARFNKQKNIFQLIKAFFFFSEEYPNFSLKLYGRGPLYNKAVKYKYTLRLGDKIKFMGVKNNWVSEEKNARMFILPSLYEGFPNSLAEACTACIPAIATDCDIGGSRSILSHFRSSSILIKKHDYISLLSAMKTMIQENIFNVKSSEYSSFFDYCNKEKVIEQWVKIIDEACI